MYEGDKIKVTHVENVAAVLNQAAEDRKNPNNGWSKDRMFRHIARIPNFAYFRMIQKYPEIDHFQDRAENKRAWHKVKRDPEFAPYFTVEGGV